MEDQPKETNTETQEPKPVGILDQVRTEKQELDKVLREVQVERAKLQELRAEQILSGKTDIEQEKEKPAEISNKEYAEKFSSGELPIK